VDEDLIAYLRTNKLDIIHAKELPRLVWAGDKTKLEKAVEDYLAVRSWLLFSCLTFLPCLNSSILIEMGHENGHCK
jgi:hypothetical protein